jgi:hypothetical protein
VPSFKTLFTAKPDLTPYDAVQPSVDLNEMNSQTAFGAAERLRRAFDREDAAPAGRLNRMLWHSIKGKHVPYPKIRSATGSEMGPPSHDSSPAGGFRND